MINPKMVDWIRKQEAKGYTHEQIYSHLAKHGYNTNDVNEALNLISKSQRQISQQQPVKKRNKIIPIIIMILLAIAIVVDIVFFIIPQNNKALSDSESISNDSSSDKENAIATVPINDSLSNEDISSKENAVSKEQTNNSLPDQGTENLTEQTNDSLLSVEPDNETETANDSLENEISDEEALESGCDLFPDKLDSCANFSCQFIHPLTGEIMDKEILGIIDGKCDYVEQMPNGGEMDCNFTESMRIAIAKYYKDVAAANSTGTEFGIDSSGQTETNYTIDGKVVSNPLMEAISIGQCVISGYDD